VIHSDTHPAAAAEQLEVLRRMSGEQRMLLAFEMTMFARELATARLKREHPDWCDVEILRELLRLAFLPRPLPAGF
jgi:hypothetical protein